jgi:diguanylate cyclase (GGDEF)-like protein
VEQLKLLIIEDDPDQLDLLRETLEDRFGKGTVVGVCTGREALARDTTAFDLILCDYNLPDASGMEVLEKIVARSNTPVLMVTGENVGHTAVEAIRRGATDYVVKTGDYLFTLPLVVEKALTIANVKRENELLRLQLQHTLDTLKERNQQLQDSLQRVEELAATDPLTGLYNRRHFAKLLDQMFAEARRYDTDLACVMVDLDHYKHLNDSYGHQVGDELLVLAGKVICANLRAADAAARYGGDEFVLLLPHASNDEASLVGQRIREEFVAASAGLLKRAEGVTMSMGVASLKAHGPVHADQLVAAADRALYRAKDLGKNRICVADPQAAPAGGACAA